MQAALDRASVGRTTFVVAHRLSTIRNAHKIIVIDAGRVKEMGTHNELVEAKGIYYNMARLQQQDKAVDEENHEVAIEKVKRAESRMSMNSVSKLEFIAASEDESKDNSVSLRRLWTLIKPDKWLIIIATISSFIVGLSIPVYSFIFGEILSVISNINKDTIYSEVIKYALIFLAMGIIIGTLNFFQVSL